MEWLIGIFGVVAGLVAATWMAYRAGSADQRARTSASLARLLERRRAKEAEADAGIERRRAAATAEAESRYRERTDEADRDVEAAERALRERTKRPWPPER